MVFQIYVAKDGTEVSMFPVDKEYAKSMWAVLTHTVYGERMVLEATFWAESWEEAKVARDAIMGWASLPEVRVSR